jgi:hypothetical protein
MENCNFLKGCFKFGQQNNLLGNRGILYILEDLICRTLGLTFGEIE